MGIKLSLDTLIETILKSIGDNSLLNEITIQDKYTIEKEKGKTTLDFHTYMLICQLDPTVRSHYYAGKYCNWLLQKFDVSKIRDREYKRSIRVALEQYNDGVKRGILKRHGISSDIGSFKSVEDLVSTMSNIMGGGTQMSQSASNHMDRLKGQYEIVGESENWMIVCPKTFEAERYFGSGTEWCTVANEEYFNSYRKRGDLYITVPKNMDNELKMQFHFNSQSFADFEDCVYDNPKVCIFNVLGDGKEFNEVYEMWSKRSMVFDELYKFVKISDVEGLLASGKDPYDVFDGVWYDDNGVRKVMLNNKYNLIDDKNKLLSPNMWFDGCGRLQPNECVIVRIKHLYNFLNVRTREFLYNKPVEEWFYDVGEFFDGFAFICMRLYDGDVKYNFINGNGEFLWKKPYEEWFDFVTGFHNGYGRACLQDVWYKIDTNGNLHDNETNEKIILNEKRKNNSNITKISESRLKNSIFEALSNVLNEITLRDKYIIEKDRGKTNLQYRDYETICCMDPTLRYVGGNIIAGKYCNWLLQRFNTNKLHDTEYKRSVKIALEQYNDGLKRGILKRYGINRDIGSFRSTEDLVSTMNGVMGVNDNISISVSNHMEKLNGQYEIVGETANWMVVWPKTFEAERYFGSGTEWCTVANEEYFNSYTKQGKLLITTPKNMDKKLKMQFHFASESFADFEDDVENNPKNCIAMVLGEKNKEFDEVCEMWSKISEEFCKYKFVKFSEIESRLESGEDIFDIFDVVFEEENGLTEVVLNAKHNFITSDNRLLSPDIWFDGTGNSKLNGYSIVAVGHFPLKYNFINTKGEFLYNKPVDEWFDTVCSFSEDKVALVGFMRGFSSNKYNYIKPNGDFVWKKPYEEWFDFGQSFKGGYAFVIYNQSKYKLDIDGNLHSYDIQMKDVIEKNKISERKSNNMTNIIKINESQLRNIVAESLNRILNEEQNVEKWLASGWHKFPDEIPEIGRKVCVADSHNNVEGHLSTPIAWDGETFRTNLAHTIRYVDVNDVTFWKYI